MKNDNLPIVLIPETIKTVLDQKNPNVFSNEDFFHLFAVLIMNDDQSDKAVLLITHAFSDQGLVQSYTHVDTNVPHVLDRIRVRSNGLSVVASAMGLNGHTVGTWHTHPDNPSTRFSQNDLNDYREKSVIGGLNFWLAPIACRWQGLKYTQWQIYLKGLDHVCPLPNNNVIVVPDDEAAGYLPNLGAFLAVDPEHFLLGVFSKDDEERVDVEFKGKVQALDLQEKSSPEGRLPEDPLISEGNDNKNVQLEDEPTSPISVDVADSEASLAHSSDFRVSWTTIMIGVSLGASFVSYATTLWLLSALS
jgi:hypothetical protein